MLLNVSVDSSFLSAIFRNDHILYTVHYHVILQMCTEYVIHVHACIPGNMCHEMASLAFRWGSLRCSHRCHSWPSHSPSCFLLSMP